MPRRSTDTRLTGVEPLYSCIGANFIGLLDSHLIQLYNMLVRSYKEVKYMKRLPDAEFDVMNAYGTINPL